MPRLEFPLDYVILGCYNYYSELKKNISHITRYDENVAF